MGAELINQSIHLVLYDLIEEQTRGLLQSLIFLLGSALCSALSGCSLALKDRDSVYLVFLLQFQLLLLFLLWQLLDHLGVTGSVPVFVCGVFLMVVSLLSLGRHFHQFFAWYCWEFGVWCGSGGGSGSGELV